MRLTVLAKCIEAQADENVDWERREVIDAVSAGRDSVDNLETCARNSNPIPESPSKSLSNQCGMWLLAVSELDGKGI